MRNAYSKPQNIKRIKDFTNTKVGRLTVQRLLGVDIRDSYNVTMWEALCDCGSTIEVSSQYLKSKTPQSCGCYVKDNPVRKLDITGEVYGQLTALRNTGKQNRNGCYIWEFLCSCGNHLEREIGNIRHRRDSAKCDECNSKQLSELITTHGASKGDKVYKSWCKIKERCFNPNDACYPRYGAAGITLYEPWKNDFIAFRDYIGYPPKDGKRYSVDRVDNSVGYFPDNVRWATDSQQARNKGKQINNTSGVSGVNWENKVWPCGKNSTTYATAQWKGLNKEYHKKSFSAKKYGEELAFFMACEYREQQINLLNLQGAGYTEGHGKVKSLGGLNGRQKRY